MFDDNQLIEEDEEFFMDTQKYEQENEPNDGQEAGTSSSSLKMPKDDIDLEKMDAPRRSGTDIDRRRVSMQQRRLSNVQVRYKKIIKI